MATPHPLSRPRDTYILFFLASYAPIVIFCDCVDFYPSQYVPQALLDNRVWYKAFFNDTLSIEPPLYFLLFTAIELFYQFPIAVWGIMELWNKGGQSGRIYGHLLMWSALAAFTTLVCEVEFYFSEKMTAREKWIVGGMYGAYMLIFTLIGADIFCRFQKLAASAGKGAIGKKKKL